MNTSKKKLIIGAVVGFIVISLVTFAILSLLFPKNASKNTTEAPGGTSAQAIIETLKKPETISELNSTYTQSQTPTMGLTDINYTKVGSYTTAVPASDFVQFEQKDAQQMSNPSSVVTSIESFLSGKGLTKMDSVSATSTYTLFDSDTTACQVISLTKMNTKPASLSVSCVSKDAVTKTYEELDKLLGLYTSAASNTIKPTTIQKVSVSEGNKTLTTLNVYGDANNTKTLLFASIDSSWEYIGERPLSVGTTEGNPAGIDRTLSQELKDKIADPKYEGFLKKYIL